MSNRSAVEVRPFGEPTYNGIMCGDAQTKAQAVSCPSRMTPCVSFLFAAVLALLQIAITATSAAAQDRADIAASPTGEIKQWTNSVGMRFIRIEPGEFMMGTPETEPGRYPNEKLHTVRITGEYLLGEHEVTRGQFRAFVEATGFKTDAER